MGDIKVPMLFTDVYSDASQLSDGQGPGVANNFTCFYLHPLF